MNGTPMSILLGQATFSCLKCGAKMGSCLCWEPVTLACPTCGKQKAVPREDHDLPGAARVVTPCPDCCGEGDRPEVLYFDKDGRQIFDDVGSGAPDSKGDGNG